MTNKIVNPQSSHLAIDALEVVARYRNPLRFSCRTASSSIHDWTTRKEDVLRTFFRTIDIRTKFLVILLMNILLITCIQFSICLAIKYLCKVMLSSIDCILGESEHFAQCFLLCFARITRCPIQSTQFNTTNQSHHKVNNQWIFQHNK